MDIDSLAQALFGGRRAEEQEVETNATTRTYMGVAVSDSSDGTVRVDLGGDVTLPDDLYDEDGNVVAEWDGAGIEMSTSPQVREGQDVIVTLVGGTSTKRPMVTAVAGEGDHQNERIDAIEADYVKATTLEADVAEIGFLKADSATIADLQADTAKVHDLTAAQLTAATGYVGELQAGSVSAQDIVAGKATVGQLAADHVSVSDLDVATARISDLEADHVSVADFEAEQANIDTLQANTADIDTIRANSAKVQNLTAAQLEADHATVGSLSTTYATIANLNAANGRITNLESTKANISDLEANYITADVIEATYMHANMSNSDVAWIENGTIKNGAIVSAMINDVSANKLTAGTINGSVINVTNLNADNITTGTINGQRIGTGSLSLDKLADDVYTETEVNNIVDGLNDRIDGAIETHTGTVVPTLNNSPASSWNTTKLRDEHVGDVYYVVNSQSQQNGYCYRFTKSGSTYSWQLIKDSDVTAALSRLTTAEGKITTFDSDISTLKTDTGTLTTRTTSLETRMSDAEDDILDKVDTTTFNEVSDTVDAHSQTISQHTTALSNKADNSTVTAVTNRVTKTEQDISGINTTIGQLQTTVASKADGSTVTTISNKLNTVSDTVDGHTQSITSVQNTLSTKADSSTVSTLSTKVNTIEDTVDGHTQRLESVEDTLETKADGSTVSTLQTDYATFKQQTTQFESTIGTRVTTVENEFDNLEIGGRNLLYNTEDWSSWACTPKATVSDGVLTTANTDTSAFQRANGWFTLDKADIVDRVITISFEAKKTDATALSTLCFQIFTTSASPKSVTSGNIPEGTRAYIPLNYTSTDKLTIDNANAINSSTWTKVTLTFKPSDVLNTTSYTEYAYLAAYIGISNKVGSAQYRRLKAEFANRASDWTPAPEDIESRVDEAESSITQNATNINAKVSKNDVINQINISTEGVLINAERVEINGPAVFNAIKSSTDAAYDAKGAAATVQSNLDNLDIGGRNYILNSSGTLVSGLGSAAGSKKEYQALNVGQSYMNIPHGTQVTISFDLYMTVNTANPIVQVYNTNNKGPKSFSNSPTGTGSNSGVTLRFTAAAGTVIDERANVTGYINDRTNPSLSNNFLEFYSNYGSSNWFSISNLKLEIGNKPTDWSPAPEDSLAEEQYIYISTASGTTSINKNTTWVTQSSDVQNVWTTKRPTYNSSYPVLFVAKQSKTVGGSVDCTTPVKDDTTTVIDGSHVTTGTIDTNRLNADTIKSNIVQTTNLSASQITSGDISADRIKANVIGAINSLTAGQINAERVNATNLHVDAANIDGTLAIGKLPSTVAQKSDISDAVNAIPSYVVKTSSYVYTYSQWKTYAAEGRTDSWSTITGVKVGDTVLIKGTVSDTQESIYVLVTVNAVSSSGAITNATSHGLVDQNALSRLSIGGRNLLLQSNYNGSFTQKGITFTNNGDGSVTANGTATGLATFPFALHVTLSAGTYTLSGCPPTGSDSTYRLDILDVPISTGTTNREDYGEGRTFETVGGTTNAVRLRVASGATVNNLTVYPKLERGNKVTDWTPAPEDVDADISEAAQTATNYIVADSSGIKIADANPSLATTYLHLASNFLDFIRGGVSMLKAWVDGSVAKVRVGAESGFNTLTDNEGIKLREGTDIAAQFTKNVITLCGGAGRISAGGGGAISIIGTQPKLIGKTSDDTSTAMFSVGTYNGTNYADISAWTDDSNVGIQLYPVIDGIYSVPTISIESDGSDVDFAVTDLVNAIPVTLYDNDSASASAATTLSESAANFRRLTIMYRDQDNTYSSVDVWNPNGKRVALDLTWINGASTQQMYQRVRWVTISGTTISTYKGSSDSKYRTGQVRLGGSYSVTNSDYISIVHVIGYR